MIAQQGDLVLTNTADGGDLTFENGAFVMDGGLQTAVYISLFTRSWWAGEFTGHLARAVEQVPLTSASRVSFERAAERDLAWLIREGVATRVQVTARIPKNKQLVLAVEIDGQSVGRWSINWENFFLPQDLDAFIEPTIAGALTLQDDGFIFLQTGGALMLQES